MVFRWKSNKNVLISCLHNTHIFMWTKHSNIRTKLIRISSKPKWCFFSSEKYIHLPLNEICTFALWIYDEIMEARVFLPLADGYLISIYIVFRGLEKLNRKGSNVQSCLHKQHKWKLLPKSRHIMQNVEINYISRISLAGMQQISF